MKKDHLTKKERKQVKQNRNGRKFARGRGWNEDQPVQKMVY